MKIEIKECEINQFEEVKKLIIKSKLAEEVSIFNISSCSVAVDNNKVVGCSIFNQVNDVVFLDYIVTDKNHRKQGIGTLLLRAGLQKYRDSKYIALCTMFYTFKFFRKFGFETCPRHKLPICIGEYPQFKSKRYKKCAVMVRTEEKWTQRLI